MTVRPITVEPEQVHIHADRRLAFQALTAFGSSADGGGDGSSRVLRDEGNKKLVEFHTPLRFMGRKTVFPTTEWVTLTEPKQIDFELVPRRGVITGGLKLLRDRFTLEDTGGCTLLTYDSTFGIRWSWAGWLLGTLVFRRTLKSMMRHHVGELKEMIEARARRSRVYPQVETCPEIAR